jgi:hypothetical protein
VRHSSPVEIQEQRVGAHALGLGNQPIPHLLWSAPRGTHLRRDTVIPQWFQASKAAAASDEHAVHC